MPNKAPGRCQICGCETYEDEPRSYCQDCKSICERIAAAHGRSDNRKRGLPPAEREARERRVQQWAATVQAKLFPRGVTS